MGLLSNPTVSGALGNVGSQIGGWFENLIGGGSGPELLNWE